jgi:hypothetical protein
MEPTLKAHLAELARTDSTARVFFRGATGGEPDRGEVRSTRWCRCEGGRLVVPSKFGFPDHKKNSSAVGTQNRTVASRHGGLRNNIIPTVTGD